MLEEYHTSRLLLIHIEIMHRPKNVNVLVNFTFTLSITNNTYIVRITITTIIVALNESVHW